MKALTIKQPWASLIVHGIKDIENRTWRTHFRGRIYIHASTQYADTGSTLNGEGLTMRLNGLKDTSTNYSPPLIED